MKAKLLRIAGLAIALFMFGSIVCVSIHAQQGAARSSAAPVTTNWVGHLVVGKTETMDPMPGTMGPHPVAVREVEIGLRSDGVVVWRETPMMK